MASDIDILLKLRRAYSKDEVVASINQQLKEKEFEVGMLKSTISELEYEIEKLTKVSVSAKQQVKNLKDQQRLKKYKKTVKHARENMRFWQNKYFTELSRKNK